MVVLGGILRAIAGFLVALLITEVLIGNPPNQTGFDWALSRSSARSLAPRSHAVSAPARLHKRAGGQGSFLKHWPSRVPIQPERRSEPWLLEVFGLALVVVHRPSLVEAFGGPTPISLAEFRASG
jgi:hypothetical protein